MIVADPAGGFWAVATNGNGSNVQTLRSADLTSWEQGPDALPELPDWTSPGKVWAPEVEEAAGDRYLLYYTTIGPDPAIQCVSVAVGAEPGRALHRRAAGKPLICEKDQGGTIDAHPFTTAAGKRYLYWKNDGNAVGVDTYLSVAELDADRPPAGREADPAVQAGPALGGGPGRGAVRLGARGPLPPVLLGQRLRLRRRTRSGTRWPTTRSGPFTKSARPGAGHQRRRRRPRSLLPVRAQRPGLDGLPRLDPRRDRRGRPRPGHVAERGHLRRRRHRQRGRPPPWTTRPSPDAGL